MAELPATFDGVRPRVLVVEDHPAVREGMAALLERHGGASVVGQAETPLEALARAVELEPDVIVLDLMLGAADGLALIKDLGNQVPSARVLVFTLQPENVYAVRCLRAGARGFVTKNEPVATLYAAVHTLARGGMHFSPTVTQAVLESAQGLAPRARGSVVTLSDRELQVFRLTGLATPTREIAAELGVSVKTIEAHRENIKNKLSLHTHAELTARAAAWLRDPAAS
jgi:DNA-binding NarL/FixJ family response regulator